MSLSPTAERTTYCTVTISMPSTHDNIGTTVTTRALTHNSDIVGHVVRHRNFCLPQILPIEAFHHEHEASLRGTLRPRRCNLHPIAPFRQRIHQTTPHKNNASGLLVAAVSPYSGALFRHIPIATSIGTKYQDPSIYTRFTYYSC